jgi:hypothetical protein
MYIPITILQHTTSVTSVFTSPDGKTDPLRSVISIGQQSIVIYLSLKGLSAVEIHNDLVATLAITSHIDVIHSPSGEGARSGTRIEDGLSTRTMLALTLRRRLLNSLQAMA